MSDPTEHSTPAPSRRPASPAPDLGPSRDGSPLRAHLHEVIFEADTPLGRAFDLALLGCILASVVAVIMDSVASVHVRWGHVLWILEWVFTLLFTLEYGLRLYCVKRPAAYARSFFGIVDLLAILPSYLSLVFTGTHSLIVIRALRLLRVFRVLKLGHFVGAQSLLRMAILASARKIIVFLGFVLSLVVIIGSVMYLVEGPQHGFTSIPQAMYWAIVTMTTVGYGDIAPQTLLGKLLASTVMILGYGIIAVPTGIVTVELSRRSDVNTQACPTCGRGDHDVDARFCKYCGNAL